AQLLHIQHGLHHEQVHPAGQERLHLPEEGVPDLDAPRGAEGIQGAAHGTDRPGHQHGPARDLPGAAGELGPLQVDPPDLLLQAVRPQAEGVGPEGVGLDQVGPGRDVGQVDLLHHPGLAQVEPVQVPPGAAHPLVELGPHAPVGQHHPLRQSLAEAGPGAVGAASGHRRATASTSTRAPLGRAATPTVARAGLWVKKRAYTWLTASKWLKSVRKRVTFTTFSSRPPAASTTACRFRKARSAWAVTPPSTSWPVAGSKGIWPETK